MPFTLDQVNPRVRETRYAVRGPIVIRAQELERQGREISTLARTSGNLLGNGTEKRVDFCATAP